MAVPSMFLSAAAPARARNERLLGSTRRLAAAASLEISARDLGGLEAARQFLPDGASVSITWMAKDTHDERVAAARAVRAAGLDPLPHIAARGLRDVLEFEMLVTRLRAEADVAQMFVIGGDIDGALGEFNSALELLARCKPARHGIRRIGVGAYPDGHPKVPRSTLRDQLEAKLALIADDGVEPFVITQFTFDSSALQAWLETFRSRGNDCHVRVGIPGPASIPSLLRYARLCGVATSARAIARHGGAVTKFLGEASPDPLFIALAGLDAFHASANLGAHLFPFGGVERSARWIAAVAAGHFRMYAGGGGFELVP